MGIGVAVGAAAAAEVAGVGLMAAAGWLLLRAAEHPPLGVLALAIVVVRALAVGRGGLRYVERLVGHRVVLERSVGVRGRLFDAVAGSGGHLGGDALSRVVSDVEGMQDAVLRCVVPWGAAGVVGVVGGGAAFLVDARAGWVVVGGLVVVGVVGWARTGVSDAPALRARLAVAATELVRGGADLVAFGADGGYRDRAVAASGAIERSDRRSDGFVQAAVAVVGAASALGAGLAAAHRGLPVAAALVLGLLAVFEVASPAVVAGRRWPEHKAAVDRVRELLATAGRETERGGGQGGGGQGDGGQSGDGPGGDGPGGEGVERIAGVASRWSVSGRVAVVGPSGAGKSTLLRGIAAGLEAGRVRGVFPDDHVFAASLRDNVLLGADARPHADVLAPWLAELPGGWDTEVTAETVSGGQRARVLLARALTAAPDVLLLDEPVEGLDPATADALMVDLLAYPGHVVVATHRLAALPLADEVLVLCDGEVVDRGTHAELLARPGYYRDRWLSERAIDAATASAGGRPPPR